MVRLGWLVGVVMCAPLVGCGSDEAVHSPQAVPLTPGDTELCVQALIPNGFGLAWERLNHRISEFAVSYDPGTAVACDGQTGASANVFSIGGDFSTGEVAIDEPIARLAYAVVGAYDPDTTPSQASAVDVALGQTTLEIDPSQNATVELPDLNLSKTFETEVVAIAGLALSSNVAQGPDYPEDYEARLGYTSRGVALEVDEAKGEVSVAFRLGLADRDNVNRAIAVANTRAIAHLAKIGFSDGAVTRASHSLSHTYPGKAFGESDPLPELPSGKTALVIQGQPGFDRATVVLTGFDYLFFGSKPDAGDYMREITFRPRQMNYDSATGKMTLTAGIYASNASIITEGPMELDARVELALLQWNGGGKVEQLEHDATFVVGEHTVIALPLVPAR